MSDSVQPHRRQPIMPLCPWDSPGKNTGVDCHFLLQCMKVKSESEVAQSCLTLSDPMDCSLPGSSVHGFSRQEYWSGVPLPSSSPKQSSTLLLPKYNLLMLVSSNFCHSPFRGNWVKSVWDMVTILYLAFIYADHLSG